MKLTNTLSGKLEVLDPIDQKQVRLYVCGITPYDYAHVGHGRCYVSFDVLYRLLTFLGYNVMYCRNFTDIDDKMLKRAEETYNDRHRYPEITKKFIAAYQEDMKKLNCLDPTFQPRVTDHIDDIIKFVDDLVKAGKAYVVDGDVYFSIDSFSEYGKLSKHKTADLRAGDRIAVNSKKRDPLDFALWKSEPDGEFWKSPWGYGRPGWHIECSALAEKHLGREIDIHAGGLDLVFPHHENEIAQSEARHEVPFARVWVHNGFVRIAKEKMSKSLGNFFTLRQIFQKYDPMVVRFYLLNHQYRAPLDFSFEDLDAVKKSYQRLCRVFSLSSCSQDISNEEIKGSLIVQSMLAFLTDDLNTPGMFGVLFENLSKLQNDERSRCLVKLFLQRVLGLKLEPLVEPEVVVTKEMEQLIKERERAREEKDWSRADAIRDKLKELGYVAQDKKVK